MLEPKSFGARRGQKKGKCRRGRPRRWDDGSRRKRQSGRSNSRDWLGCRHRRRVGKGDLGKEKKKNQRWWRRCWNIQSSHEHGSHRLNISYSLRQWGWQKDRGKMSWGDRVEEYKRRKWMDAIWLRNQRSTGDERDGGLENHYGSWTGCAGGIMILAKSSSLSSSWPSA